MQGLNIYQIYFDEKSKSNCFNEWNKYDNSDKLTEYFENEVIVDLVQNRKHRDSEYFGVFSHDARSHIRFKEGDLVFNPQNLQTVIENNKDIDWFAFEKRRKQENIIFQAERYHRGFVKIVQAILEETGFLPEIPTKLDKIVLFNHFIARSEVYQRYVDELLIPAIKVLKTLPETFNDAKYKNVDERTKKRFIRSFGKPYYPFHPFICERLPSLFLHKYEYSFKQIF